MNGKTRGAALLALLALATSLALAACGGGGGSAYGNEGSSSSEAAASGGRSYGNEGDGSEAAASGSAAGAATVSIGTASGAGEVLVDSEGLTLYYFEKDEKGGDASTCEGACAEAWPPLTTEGAPKVEGEADSSLLGTIERGDGTTQVTYAGWPLYTFVSDKEPGEDNGTDSDAFGAPWYPIHANGEKAGE